MSTTGKRLLSLIWIVVLLLVGVIAMANSLRLTKMNVPEVIDFRDDLRLDCQFDMGGEELYAVKWYKDDNEFFRYMPHQMPNTITFPVFGVHLQNESTECGPFRCQVLLSNLLRVKSSGAYRCEVSTEAPAFRLASETQNVTVAAVPKDNPSIEGLEDSYVEGEILTAKCVSSASDPPQLITWFINKEPAPGTLIRDMKISKPDLDGLRTTSQIIRFVIEEKHVNRSNHIQLNCMASFDGSPTSARNATKKVLLFDHRTQINNPRYTYWYSSSSPIRTDVVDVLAFALLVAFLQAAAFR